MKRLLPLLLLIMALSSCIKDELILDNQIQVEGLDPSFALPLGIVTLNLGDIEQSQDINNLVINEEDQIFALSFGQDLFDYSYGEILDIPAQAVAESFESDAAMSAGINLLSTGSSIDYPMTTALEFAYSNGEQIDLINIQTGSLNINFNSEFKQNIDVHMEFPTINLNGNPLILDQTVYYTGSIPIISLSNIALDGYDITFDTDGVSVPIDINIRITKTNELVAVGDALNFSFGIDIDRIESVYGYFGQYTNVAAEGNQAVSLFPNLGEGSIVFGDPQINLTITNSAGIDVAINLDNVEFETSNGTNSLTGSDLTSFPTILGADTPGEETITEHTIDNSGVSPDLGTVLDLSNTNIVYTASVTTNPDGYAENFILESSKISCHAQVILPLFLGVDDFTFVDTIAVDLANILNVDENEPNSIDVDDVDKVTMRLLVENGFPLDIGAKIYFANEQNNILDSLWITDDYQYIFESAQVDFSQPDTNSDYGRVISSTSSFTDFILTRQKLQTLVDAGSSKLIIKSIGSTADAGSGELVKFYPDYEIKIKVSAKVDLSIDLN